MTDDLRARLEEDQRIIDAATDGPWEAGDRWVYTMPVYEDDNRLSNVLGMRYADRDRERQESDRAQRNVNFITASRTRWEQANQALLAVIEMHAPEEGLHEHLECTHIHCRDLFQDQMPWPCPTVKAIQEVYT